MAKQPHEMTAGELFQILSDTGGQAMRPEDTGLLAEIMVGKIFPWLKAVDRVGHDFVDTELKLRYELKSIFSQSPQPKLTFNAQNGEWANKSASCFILVTRNGIYVTEAKKMRAFLGQWLKEKPRPVISHNVTRLSINVSSLLNGAGFKGPFSVKQLEANPGLAVRLPPALAKVMAARRRGKGIVLRQAKTRQRARRTRPR